ncbi:phosphatidylinositol-glycan biosynthesis class X protein-like isoform X2 [Dendronephthya gigantea]|uniref:phosphatidylinositol-glycan biosynthesis class X protein-like isoform X2 n=1 Tax=Dendronephthya gigantea TaxID=151771 RepID=UPI001069CAF0|nr:phosphatidylinositol-glycan biosynthesis class X protein-like isoform X2 [Dendronephthya gigantea]
MVLYRFMEKLRYFAFFVCFYGEVSAMSTECDSLITISVERTVHKEGFHREVVSQVSWYHDDPKDGDCSLLFLHYIPREMFVDLDEINRSNLTNAKVLPLGDKKNFDVERPAHLSTAQTVLVYSNIKKQIQHRSEGKHWQLTSDTMLPVHWRYQKPSDNQHYITVSLPQPTLMVLCRVFLLVICKNVLTSWRKLNIHAIITQWKCASGLY